MSIALVTTRGFGNGTLSGDITNVTTRGFTIAESVTLINDGAVIINPLDSIVSSLIRTIFR